jgi:hypothetical protein
MIRRIPPERYRRSRLRVAALFAAFGMFPEAGNGARALDPVVSAHLARPHPVHVSSTQVDLSRDGRSLEVTVRLFTDDLEEALKATGRPVSVHKAPSAVVDSALSAYVGERVQFGLDGAALARGRLIGHEQEDDATLVFVEVPLRTKPVRIAIAQRVLLEQYDDQTNLLHLRFGTVKRSALLRRGNERAEFVLQ